MLHVLPVCPKCNSGVDDTIAAGNRVHTGSKHKSKNSKTCLLDGDERKTFIQKTFHALQDDTQNRRRLARLHWSTVSQQSRDNMVHSFVCRFSALTQTTVIKPVLLFFLEANFMFMSMHIVLQSAISTLERNWYANLKAEELPWQRVIWY